MGAEALEQRSEAWFAARVGRITGSRVGAILGNNPHQSPEAVMREMVREALGLDKDFQGNAATAHGERFEDEAISEYELHSACTVQKVGFVEHPDIDFLGASPDGLLGKTGLLEVKCPAGLKAYSIKPWHRDQVQLGLACTGREWAHYWVWTPTATKLQVIDRDPLWLDMSLPTLEAFIERYRAILADPELQTPYRQQGFDQRGDDAWVEVEAELARVQEQIRELSDQEATLKKRLIKLAGDRRARGSAFEVVRTSPRTTVDYKAACEAAKVDVTPYTKQGGKAGWTVRKAPQKKS